LEINCDKLKEEEDCFDKARVNFTFVHSARIAMLYSALYAAKEYIAHHDCICKFGDGVKQTQCTRCKLLKKIDEAMN
jgi:dTDP-glucose pyrophosphorylase